MKPVLFPVLALTSLLVACSDNPSLVASESVLSGDGNQSEVSSVAVSARNDEVEPLAPTRDGTSITGPQNIVLTAFGAGDFNILTLALDVTGLNTVLAEQGASFTVFAPTDDAFRKLGNETIAALLNDTDTLRDILLYHVFPDAAVSAAAASSLAGESIVMANEDRVALSLQDGRLFVNASEVVRTDIGASNGIIHAIDTVLTPPIDMDEAGEQAVLNIVETAAATEGFSTLVAALQATGLDALLSDEQRDFTVFAPTDAAFAALGQDTIDALLGDLDRLSDILAYHVVPGQLVDAATAISLAGQSIEAVNAELLAVSLRDGELFINDSRVIMTDIVTSNGIIHVIDAVLLPPIDPVVPVTEAPETAAPTGTILDVARDAGFTTLVAALEATGLDDALGHPDDNYTVFAPTDAAFAALGQDTINALLADPATLRDILAYHVLPGSVVPSSALPDILGFDIQTGNGEFVQFSQQDGNFLVNGVLISTTDVPAVNGVIHVIDAVLLPPGDS